MALSYNAHDAPRQGWCGTLGVQPLEIQPLEMAISYNNLSRLVRSSDLLPRLQYLKLVGGEKNVNFQWLGPHFLAFLRYAKKLCLCSAYMTVRFRVLLMGLDDLASDCILYGETELYKKFKDAILSFMPELREFFVFQKLQKVSYGDSTPNELVASFIGFLVETIRELLNCGTGSNVLVSNQVKFLLKKLESLLAFVADTPTQLNEKEQNNNIMTEIESVANEAGFFLHSFFFTTELVTETNMDLTLTALVERIETVQLKIKDHCIVVPKQPDCGIGSLQVAESPSEVSSHVTKQIEKHLLRGLNNCQIISIVGMPGLGKTTLAKKLYNDYKVHSHFDVRSWCVVSQTYKKRKLLIDILRSATASDINRDKISEMEDEKLAERLYKNLKGRRYFIVMDDLWDKEAWDDLKRLFPEDTNGSRVLFTSRLKNLASELSHAIIEPPPLSQAASWDLLEQQVFNKERCPHDLQDIGKEIATNCHGLPLLVVVIASVLSNMEKKISLWQQVATSLSSYISEKADEYIPILKLSYKNLPIHLKPCFLYLSAFEEDEEISVRKLLLLWIAEGFIEKKEQRSLEDVAEEYLVELINRSLLQVAKTRSDNGVKSCTMHDLILDMCSKIAAEEKFLFEHQYLICKGRRRLCMDQSHNLSEALSIHYNLEKFRILELLYKGNDLLEIMPDLRYLKIHSLKSSIQRLQNLEVLVMTEGISIPTYLLNMPKLRHLHLKVPARFKKDCDSSQINSLQTLSIVSIVDSKDEEILKCSPNLRRLKCIFPSVRSPDLHFLTQLESLKMSCESRLRSRLDLNFPTNIKKLTLSRMSLRWKKMSSIGTLPNLEILKLHGRSFKGEVWNTKDDEFQKLKFLKLYFLDLKKWNSSYNHFPVLERLVLQDCKRLEMIPSEFSNILTLQKIEVYFCGIDVENSAFQIREEQRNSGNEEFEVNTSKEGVPITF